MNNQTLEFVGQILLSHDQLRLKVTGAAVVVRHEDRADIGVKANFPDNWVVFDNQIRQVSKSNSSTINTTGDGNVVVSGSVNSSIIITGSSQVWVGGVQVGGEESGEQAVSDRLEIVVPTSYRGGLWLTNTGAGSVSIDSWEGGGLTISNSGRGALKTGPLTGLAGAFVESSGLGAIELVTLKGKKVSVFLEGRGNITLGSLESETFNANLEGMGNFTVESLTTTELKIEQSGPGDFSIARGSAQSGSISNSGFGNTKLTGDFEKITRRATGAGSLIVKSGA